MNKKTLKTLVVLITIIIVIKLGILLINNKRKNCLKKAEEFKRENIIKIIKDKIGK